MAFKIYAEICLELFSYSPIFIFFKEGSLSSRGRLRSSFMLGILREISACCVPRSISSVVIWAWNSTDAGCFRTLRRWSLRFFRTLLTWDLARVGGRLAVGGNKERNLWGTNSQARHALAQQGATAEVAQMQRAQEQGGRSREGIPKGKQGWEGATNGNH